MAQANQENDPLSILHNGIEAYLKTVPCVKRAWGTSLKNIIAYNKIDGTEQNDTNVETSLPELRLAPIGGDSNINHSSATISLNPQYEISLLTGSLKVTSIAAERAKLFFPIYWSIFAALSAGIDGSTLTGLTWRGQPFVKNFNLDSSKFGQTDTAAATTPSIAGWSGICTVTFNLLFNRHFVKDYAGQL